MEFGIQGDGMTKAVSLDCLVLVHVTVIVVPQDVKVTSLHDKVEKVTGVRENGLSVFPGL